MHLVYVDEVKFQAPQEPYYWLCALGIPEADITSVERALASIATEYFASGVLDRTTEFHAVDIVQGKGPYKKRGMASRVGLFNRLANVINDHPAVARIAIRLDPAQMTREDYHHIAFMYLVERVDELMRSRDSKALLIVDHDNETVTPNIRSLAHFKASGTDFHFGREISAVVDTVHHTHSEHSRLLQLADIYAYSMSLVEKRPTDYPKSDIVQHINGLANYTWPTKYKYWPQNVFG